MHNSAISQTQMVKKAIVWLKELKPAEFYTLRTIDRTGMVDSSFFEIDHIILGCVIQYMFVNQTEMAKIAISWLNKTKIAKFCM